MPTDEEIREMLAARGARARTGGLLDEARSYAQSNPRRRLDRWLPSMRPLLAGLAGVGLVAVLGVVVAGLVARGPSTDGPSGPSGPSGPPGTSGTFGSSAPSAGATSAASPSPVPPASPVIGGGPILTPDALSALMAADPGALTGQVFVVRGRLAADAGRPCASSGDSGPCPPVVLVGLDGAIVVPIGDRGPGPWDSGGAALEGDLALRVTGATGPFVLEFLGLVEWPPRLMHTWAVPGLIAADPPDGPALYLVRAWIVSMPPLPCPFPLATPGNSLGLSYTVCPFGTYLTDERYEPVHGNQIGPPTDGLQVQSGSATPQPAEGYFLVQRIVIPPCGPTADCATGPADRHWRLVATAWPTPPGAGEATPTPALATPSPVPSSTSTPAPTGAARPHRTVAQLAALPLDELPGEFVVDAWLVATPPLRCRLPPLASGALDLRCGEADWLTDAPFQPWTADGTSGSARGPDPATGVRVPNGTYARFAPGPAPVPGGYGALEPRFGTYLIRTSVHSTCELVPLPTGAVCAGGPVWVVEVVGRLSP